MSFNVLKATHIILTNHQCNHSCTIDEASFNGISAHTFIKGFNFSKVTSFRTGKNRPVAARNHLTRICSGFTNAHLYSNLALVHNTPRTHKYLSKHICRGHQTSRAGSRQAPLPAYTVTSMSLSVR